MELMDIVVTVAIGVVIGVGMIVVYAWYLYRDLKQRVDKMMAEVIAEVENNLVGLHIEIDKDTYFCYNDEDKQFVCQGNTVEDLRRAFSERFPGKTAYLAGGDPILIEKLKSELSKLQEQENNESITKV
jgi:hypothetical protein